MKKVSILTVAFCLLFSYDCIAQKVVRKSGNVQQKTATTPKKGPVNQRKTTSPKTQVNDGAEINVQGHIDFLLPDGEQENKIQIDKNVKADFMLKLFRDPSDRTRPIRKTAILTCDIDWKALTGDDKDVPIDWSWSGKTVEVVKQEDKGCQQYAIMDGNKPVALLLYGFKDNKGKAYNLVFLYGGGNQLTGLRQGMHIDDLARTVQSEIPGTRVVVTGRTENGLKEYVLLSFGENKVYEVTGNYHYSLNNNEPYFTFWTDSKDKLVKWFALKRIR
jgi:hypothetical protein